MGIFNGWMAPAIIKLLKCHANFVLKKAYLKQTLILLVLQMCTNERRINDTVIWIPVKLMNESLYKTTSIENNLPEREVTTKQPKRLQK